MQTMRLLEWESTLLKAKQQGIETHLVVLTDGSQGGKIDDLVEVRRQEVRKVADLLGIASLKNWSNLIGFWRQIVKSLQGLLS